LREKGNVLGLGDTSIERSKLGRIFVLRREMHGNNSRVVSLLKVF
jgi:hypothetical protein